MKIENLSQTPFDELVQCFLKAFEGYYVTMPQDPNYYRERWKAAMVDFNLSYGIFDNGTLIGFVIHAIDHRDGKLTAFNVGTGVVPEYRGKKLVQAIYDFAFLDLKKKGIERIALEVITKNTIAIRAYEGIGLEICRDYKCFRGTITPETSGNVPLQEVEISKVQWETLPNQEFYSWENQKESILSGSFKYFQVLHNQMPESYFIIKPESGYVAQCDVFSQSVNSWKRLFSGIAQLSPTVRINNVDVSLPEKIHQLKKLGLENHIDQFEMELLLN